MEFFLQLVQLDEVVKVELSLAVVVDVLLDLLDEDVERGLVLGVTDNVLLLEAHLFQLQIAHIVIFDSLADELCIFHVKLIRGDVLLVHILIECLLNNIFDEFKQNDAQLGGLGAICLSDLLIQRAPKLKFIWELCHSHNIVGLHLVNVDGLVLVLQDVLAVLSQICDFG